MLSDKEFIEYVLELEKKERFRRQLIEKLIKLEQILTELLEQLINEFDDFSYKTYRTSHTKNLEH